MPISSRMRWAVGAVLLGGLAAAAGLGFSPLARSRLATAAAKRGLVAHADSVRPGWFSLVVNGVHVQLDGVDGVDAFFPRATVELSAALEPKGVTLEDGRITLKGDADALRKAVLAWREARGGAGGSAGHAFPVRSVRASVAWDGDRDSASLDGLDASREDGGYSTNFLKGHVHFGLLSLAMANGAAELDAAGNLKSVKLGEADVVWSQPDAPRDGPSPAVTAQAEVAPPPLPSSTAKSSKKKGKGVPAVDDTVATTDASVPLLPLPDLHALRAIAASAGVTLAQRLPEAASADIDGLALRIEKGGEERISLGPGPLHVARSGARTDVTFTTAGGALGTPMALHAVLPADDSDVEVSLAGGPVPLSLLGLRSKYLTEIDRATLAGKGRVVLDGPGKTLTFDARLTFRGLGIREPRLASEVLRGVDFDAAARGVMSDKGELRLDEVEAAMGALHVEGHGGLEQAPDHVSAAFDFDLTPNSCEAILNSVPTALIPVLRGAHMTGTLAARGRLSFDTRKLDDLFLDYAIEDHCRLSDVSPELDKDRFTKPFAHRVYTPDGKGAEDITGPTSENWTDLEHISPFMQAAVLTTEDGGFYHHHGFSHAAIRGAIVANLKARRFVRGASTITMQLAKNLFLSRDKTLSRKLEELILTDYLEQAFTKEEMMELYLNVIEFGPNVYGITAAADHYFGRRPDELNLAECMFLSSILPQPVHYHRLYERGELPDSWLKGIRARMVIAQRTGKISAAELAEGLTEQIAFHHGNTPRPPPRPPVMAARVDDEGNSWQEL